MYAGVAKAWHIHKVQIDWWYVACGLLKVALYDTRDDSATKGQLMEFMMGDGRATCLKIPPGVAHGCRALAALRAEVAGGPGTGFAPELEGEALTVAFLGTTVHAERPAA